MSRTSDLMAFNMSPELAGIAGRVGAPVSVTAAGTTIADAALIGGHVAKLVTASGAGVKLPDYPLGEAVFVMNRSGANQSVYPHSATGTIEGGSAGAAVTLNSTKDAVFFRFSATDWLEIAVN